MGFLVFLVLMGFLVWLVVSAIRWDRDFRRYERWHEDRMTWYRGRLEEIRKHRETGRD